MYSVTDDSAVISIRNQLCRKMYCAIDSVTLSVWTKKIS